jgi:lipopolysaccharide transport system ATP-binding protein
MRDTGCVLHIGSNKEKIMAQIELKNVDIEFPIFNANSRSLKNKILQIATGGKIVSDQGRVNVRALEGLNFKLNDGDRVGLVGHNGAGKSTLLRVLSGVYAPVAGEIKISGKIGSLIDMWLGIDFESTGKENIYLRGALNGLSRAQIKNEIERITEFAELGHFIDMPVRTYSSGMYLRLAFSIATILSPEILLMDEWLSVGDSDFQIKAQQRISELVSNTSILVLASHSRELIEVTCNRVIWLEHGKIKMDGAIQEILNSYFGN